MGRPKHQETLTAIRRSVEQEDTSILLPDQLQHRERIEDIVAQMLGGDHTTNSLAEWVTNEYGCTKRMAYLWIADAKEVFGDLLPGNRRVDALLMSLQVESWIRDADAITDVKERLETKAKLLRELVRIRGLDRGDDAALDPSKLDAPKVELSLPKELKRHLMAMLRGGVLDIPAPDVPEAEIIEETGTEE